MSFYSHLFDSESHDKVSRVYGNVLLMALTLQKAPVRLSTTNAISSPLIISDACAGNEHFLSLVAAGRIQFMRWPNGEGAREAMRSVLAMPPSDYRFSGWPDVINQDQSVRELAREFISTRQGSTGDDELDHRLHLTQRLFDAIERAPKTECEDKRAGEMVKRMRAVTEYCVDDETYQRTGVLDVLKSIQDFDEHILEYRSKIFHRLDTLGAAPAAVNAAREIVNAEYNVTVAQALGYKRLHSSFCALRKPPLRSPATEEDCCSIVSVPHPRDSPSLMLSWENLANAFLASKVELGSRLNSESLGPVKELVAASFVRKRMNKYRFAINLVTTGTVASVLFSGSAAVWLTRIAATYGIARFLIADLEKQEIESARNRLNGWIARFGV